MKKNNYLKKLCICSVLAALFVALEYVSSSIGKIAFLDNYQIPISCFPLIIASLTFGLGWGAATSLVGSFISQLSYGLSWGTLIWMAPTVIYGITLAAVHLLFKKSCKPVALTVQIFISQLVLSVLNTLATYFSNLLYGAPNELLKKLFAVIVSLKLVGAVLFAVIFAIVIPPIIKSLKKLLYDEVS